MDEAMKPAVLEEGLSRVPPSGGELYLAGIIVQGSPKPQPLNTPRPHAKLQARSPGPGSSGAHSRSTWLSL